MKRLKTATYIVTIMILSSCTKDVLDKTPTNALLSSAAITNYSEAIVALTGAYNSLQGSSSVADQGFWYYGSRFIVYGDVMGDFMQPTPSGTRSSVMYQMAYTGDNAPAFWRIPYNVIRNANNIIAAIDAGKVTNAQAEDIANIRGQALFVRALAHFDLCRLYGKAYITDNGKASNGGVPLITTAVPVDALLGRNTVEEVYRQVIDDLENAAGKDPKSALKSAAANGKANKWAAKALLARVLLYRGIEGDNEKVELLADEILNTPQYGLWSADEYLTQWSNTGSKEFLFEIVSTANDNIGTESLAFLLNETGNNDYILTKKFVDIMADRPNDIRNQLFAAAQSATGIGLYGTNKVYLKKYPIRSANTHNIYVLRLSEVYLNAAEAAFKNGDKTKAAFYLNSIYQRANPGATAIAEADITLDRILLERGIELVGEGHRFFDLLRNNKEVIRYNNTDDQGWHYALLAESRRFGNDYFRVVLPIPLVERNANAVIRNQQNPGYGL